MTTANMRLLNKIFSSFHANDVEGALSCLHPKVVVHQAQSLPYSGDFVGREGFRKLIAALTSVFEVTQDSCDLFDAGAYVVARMHLTFKSRTTSRKTSMPVVELYKVEHGQITDIDIFYKDTKAIHDILV